MKSILLRACCALALLAGAASVVTAPARSQSAPITAEQDHQQMMDQLGIRKLRPGPSGNEKAPDHANYDPAKANPFPNWPEVLTLDNGRKVTNADMWWKQRRPEIVEVFEREVVGRVPANAPRVSWSVVSTDNEYI